MSFDPYKNILNTLADMDNDIVNDLLEKFFSFYGDKGNDPKIYFAPGRVNLIGEHTDYNEGFVLPVAIGYGTFLAVRKAGHGTFKLNSMNFDGGIEVPVAGTIPRQKLEWVNYPLGIIKEMKVRERNVNGLELLFKGNIPTGAGLSSSASIEMVTALAMHELYNTAHSPVELARLSQKAENDFVGLKCGIMDQFAVGMGREGHALFLDCRSLDHKQIPLNLGDYRLVIVDSKKSRGLSGSNYNERVQECHRAVSHINKSRRILSLREANLSDLERNDALKKDEIALRRARHVISENERVLRSVENLIAGNINEFGRLMIESHESLKNDYEVTGPELDLLVRSALEIEGVAGSRMTGAGFGGCTVNFVLNDQLAEFKRVVTGKYFNKTKIYPRFYIPGAGAGMQRIS